MDFTMLDTLELPFTVKDYKSLCTLLDEDIKGGNSKKAQVKEWERYLDLEKQGRAFTIHEIFEEPKASQDGRAKGNHSKYLPLLEPLLLDRIARNGRLELTKRAWWQCVGMVNDRYSFNCKAHRDALQRYDERFTELIVRDFYRLSSELLLKTWDSLLKNLMRRGEIVVSSSMMVRECGSPEYRQATLDELVEIASAESKVLKKMGYASVGKAIFAGAGEDFYKNVREILVRKCEIDKYFKTYCLEYTHGKSPRLALKERKSLLSELNDIILSTVHKKALKGYTDALECTDISMPRSEYMDIINDISEYLLRIK